MKKIGKFEIFTDGENVVIHGKNITTALVKRWIDKENLIKRIHEAHREKPLKSDRKSAIRISNIIAESVLP